MIVYYKGDNDNEYGFKYGDKLDVKPLNKNLEEFDYFGVNIYNYRTDKYTDTSLSLLDIIDNFTGYEFDLFEEDIPKKPNIENGKPICPRCGEIVEAGFSECDNCSQVLDWEDE